jgi:hypothetical protein
MVPVSSLVQAALDLQTFCESKDWKFCFIDGVANARWGVPRYTEDADVSLLTGFGAEESFIDALLGRFSARRPDAAAFAIRSRVLLLKHENGIGLDIGLAAFPYKESTVERSSYSEASDDFRGLRICSAEDFIVYKAFAGRDHDWGDIEGVLQRQRKLNIDIVHKELPWLLEAKEDDGNTLPRLEKLFVKYHHV